MTTAIASPSVLARIRSGPGDVRRLASASVGPMVMRGLGTVLGFAVSVVIGRRLGDDVLGDYAVGTGAMLLGAAVARLGQDIELTRLVASSRASSGVTPWEHIGGALLAVARVGGAIAVFGVVVGLLVGLPSTTLVGIAVVPAVAVVGSLGGVARGVDRPTLAVAIDAVVVPLGTLPMLFLAGSSTGALAGHAAIWSLVAIVGFVVVRRHAAPAPTAVFRLALAGAPLAGLATLNIALATIDVVAVDYYRGSAEAGHYTAAARLAFISTSVLVVANAVLQPRIAALWELHQQARLQRLLRITTGMLAVVAVLVAATLAIGAPWFLGVFGGEFEDAVTPMRILAIGQFVTLASGPVGAVLLMTGNARRQIQATFVAVAVNIVANVVLISEYGAVGAAIATALALSVKNLIGAYWAWRVVRVDR